MPPLVLPVGLQGFKLRAAAHFLQAGISARLGRLLDLVDHDATHEVSLRRLVHPSRLSA